MKAKKILAIIMTAVLLATMLAVFPSAHSVDDWTVVGAGADEAKLTKSETNGLRIVQEGHYPSSNAGLLYNKPLSLTDGIEITLVMENTMEGSADAWYGVFLLNKPVYFNTGAKSPDDGYGIVLLIREGGFDWVMLNESGFVPQISGGSYDDYVADKNYFAPNAEITLKFILTGGEFTVSVDGTPVDFDFSPILEYFENNEAYIGASSSMTELEAQSLVVKGLNGAAAAAEGDLEVGSAETAAPADTEYDFDNMTLYKFVDFTDPEVVAKINGANACNIEYDETNQCLKVTVTGDDPYFTVPMTKKQFFDGEKFCILKMNYMTDVDGTGEFFFTTKTVPSLALNNVQYDLEATTEFKDLELEMDYEADNWCDEIRSFRIDPFAGGEDGQVIYYKYITVEVYVEPETTTADPSATTNAPETDAPKPATTEAPSTPAEGTTPVTTKDNGGKTGGSLTWLWIVLGIVGVAIIAAVVVFITKKKK